MQTIEEYNQSISDQEAKDLLDSTTRANRLLDAQLAIAQATFTLPNTWTDTDSMGDTYTVKANLSQSEDADGTSGLGYDTMENITTANMVLAGNNLPYLEAVDLANMLSSPEGQEIIAKMQAQRKTICKRASRATPEGKAKAEAKRQATRDRKANRHNTTKQRKKEQALAFLASRKA